MIAAASTFAMIAIAVSILLNLYRLWAGPDATDRILALDTMVINAIGLIVLAGILFGTTIYFEAALLFEQAHAAADVAQGQVSDQGGEQEEGREHGRNPDEIGFPETRVKPEIQ